MGKKSKGGKRRDEESSDEENFRDGTEDGRAPTQSDTTENSASPFDVSESIDMLSEKKVNMREPSLQKIIKFLQGSHDDQNNLVVLNGYIETLTVHLTRMTRRPATTNEGKLCLQLIALLALHLGTQSDGLVKSLEKPLQVHADASTSPLQSDALFTLSFCAYAHNNEDLLMRTLEYVQNVLINPMNVDYSDELRTRAADCWVLLASLLPPSDVLSRSKDEGLFSALYAQIDEAAATSISTKISAAKAIAFIYECADKVHPGLRSEELVFFISDERNEVEAAIHAMQKISKESSKKVSKKDRKEQRAEFRDVLDFLESGEFASETLHMSGASVQVSGFAQERLVECLREVLGTGFQTSLVAFPLVREMLGVEYMDEGGGGGSPVKRGAVGKGVDKGRTKDRLRDRDLRDHYVQDFNEEW